MTGKKRLLPLLLCAALLAGLLPGVSVPGAFAQEPVTEEPVELDALPVSAAPVSAAPAPLQTDAALAASPDAPLAGFTININTLQDEWSTDTNTKAISKCSLREALQATVSGNPEGNQGCGAPSIANFAEYTFQMQGGTYVLTRPDILPAVTKKIFINGNNAVTIDGGGLQGRKLGIFQICCTIETAVLMLQKITLTHGNRESGGAIWVKTGSLRTTEVTFRQNMAQGVVNAPTATGGAVSVDVGEFVCVKSVFKENTSVGTAGALHTGGGGKFVSDRCDFIGNHAYVGGGAAQLGGTSAQSSLVRDAKFLNNFVNSPSSDTGPSAANGGGALYNLGDTLIERSEFHKNYTMKVKGGGAIRNQGELRLEDVAISYSEARIEGNEQTFGGAIVNDAGGDAFLVRTSIHHNTARYGGAIMGLGGSLYIVNSSISNNTAAFDGGIGVGWVPGFTGSETYIYHSTIVRNEDNLPTPLAINSANNYRIYMANSVIDTPCGSTINSGGGNVYKEFCARVPWDPNNDQTGTDYKAEYVPDIGLEGLNNNGGPSLPNADFLSVKVDTDSPAVDAARDERCFGNPETLSLIANKDQIAGQRPQGPKCDSGAMEVGSKPAKYESTPAQGSPLLFPAVFLGGGATQSQTTLDIKNTGGGVIQWTASIDEGWDGTFELDSPQTSGGLFSGQPPVKLTILCKPKTQGTFYGMLLIATDLPDLPEIRYKLTCHSPQLGQPFAGANSKPGPVSTGTSAPGETTMVSANFTNAGQQPVQATATWKQTAGNVWQLVGPAVAAASEVQEMNFTVAPGQSFDIEMRCTPNGIGLFQNQMQLTTNDPLNPLFVYDVGCEGYDPPDPELLVLSDHYGEGLPAKRVVGLALSPAEDELLTGHWGGTGVGVVSVNPQSGQIGGLQKTLQYGGFGTFPAVAYSHDDQNAYLATYDGNGVVVAGRDGGGTLQVTQVITRSTRFVCGVIGGNPPLLKLCPYNTMGEARGIDVSPDDKHVYVTGFGDDSLTVFTRNPNDGKLGLSQRLTSTIEGTNILDGAIGVHVSEDGLNVYVTGRVGDSLATFARNPNGQLTFVSVHRQGVTEDGKTVNGLDGAQDIAISPDGKFLYVIGYDNDAMAIFQRNPTDGFLTWQESVPVGDGPYAVIISKDPRGQRILVSHWNGDSVQVFARDDKTGTVTPIQTLTEGANSPTFDGATNVVESADGRRVYAALYDKGSVRRIRSIPSTPQLANLSPASIQIGSADLPLVINGARFYPDSAVFWDGNLLQTTFVSSRQLRATVPSAEFQAAGNHQVTVRTSGPNGPVISAAAAFAVLTAAQLPAPSIETINPPAAQFGGQPLNVVVTGFNFRPNSQVLLNGGPVKTTYVSSTTLLVELSAADISEAGPLVMTVVNTTPAAVAVAEVDATATSKPVKFETAAPNTPALPGITGFTPASLPAGSAAQWITVKGSNFSTLANAPSQALWKGEPRATIVVDANSLLMSVSAADLQAAGNAAVMVRTPGVEDSLPQNFRILAPGSNPVPVATSVFVEYGGQMSLIVSGEDIVPGAQVRINGVVRPSTALNPYQVRTNISIADLAKAMVVRVSNPGPGGGSSNGISVAPQRLVYMPLVDR